MHPHTPAESPDFATALTVPQAAKRLGVHEDTVRRWIKDGSLRAYRVGPSERLRIMPADLDAVVKGAK
jgi:excisionase family DNA binding protein